MSEVGKQNTEVEKINISEDENINTSNIFDEFEVDNIEEDIKKEVKKDGIYYISKIGNFLKIINIIAIFIVFILFSYIYIEKSDSEYFKEKGYLDPICSLLNGDGNIVGDKCSSLKNSQILINNNLKDLEEKTLLKTAEVLSKAYELEKINNSLYTLFILDKTKNKNNVLEVLNEFDILKNKFTPTLKQRIRCKDIIINEDILEAKCISYTKAVVNDIPGLNGEISVNNITGTSITQASSFLNFLSKSDKFSLIEKQKVFSKKYIFSEKEGYGYITDFKIKLKYNKNNNLNY